MVRITVNIDENLYEAARHKAFMERRPLTAVINESLRHGLNQAQPISTPPPPKGSRFPVSKGRIGQLVTNEDLARAEEQTGAEGLGMVNEGRLQ